MKKRVATGVAVTVAIVLLLLFLASSMQAGRAEALGPAELGESLASLEVIDVAVEVRTDEAGTWATGLSGRRLDQGSTVRTDVDGFAEILYADGSLTRLDGLTEYELVVLDGDALAPTITGKLDLGRTWHRVHPVTGQRGGYQVETPVGTAAVRGTAFYIECVPGPVCTFGVVEGALSIDVLGGAQVFVRAGEEVTIGLEDVIGEVAPGPAGEGPVGPGGEPGDGPTDGAPGDDPSASPSPSPTASGSPDPDATPDPSASPSVEAEPEPVFGVIGQRAVVLRRITFDPEVVAGEPTPAETPAGTPGGTPTASPSPSPSEGLPGIEGTGRRWVVRNLVMDTSTGRFGPEAAACSVTVNGRNAALAETPERAIEIDMDGRAVIDALAAGPIDTYTVHLGFGASSVQTTTGQVLPDDDGDTSSFQGGANVADHAIWGTGLYRADASTTGTRCALTAYIVVAGASPVSSLFTIPAILALLAMIAAVVAIATAATSTGSSPASSGAAAFAGGVVLALSVIVLLQQLAIVLLSMLAVAVAAATTGAVAAGGVALNDRMSA